MPDTDRLEDHPRFLDAVLHLVPQLRAYISHTGERHFECPVHTPTQGRSESNDGKTLLINTATGEMRCRSDRCLQMTTPNGKGGHYSYSVIKLGSHLRGHGYKYAKFMSEIRGAIKSGNLNPVDLTIPVYEDDDGGDADAATGKSKQAYPLRGAADIDTACRAAGCQFIEEIPYRIVDFKASKNGLDCMLVDALEVPDEETGTVRFIQARYENRHSNPGFKTFRHFAKGEYGFYDVNSGSPFNDELRPLLNIQDAVDEPEKPVLVVSGGFTCKIAQAALGDDWVVVGHLYGNNNIVNFEELKGRSAPVVFFPDSGEDRSRICFERDAAELAASGTPVAFVTDEGILKGGTTGGDAVEFLLSEGITKQQLKAFVATHPEHYGEEGCRASEERVDAMLVLLESAEPYAPEVPAEDIVELQAPIPDGDDDPALDDEDDEQEVDLDALLADVGLKTATFEEARKRFKEHGAEEDETEVEAHARIEELREEMSRAKTLYRTTSRSIDKRELEKRKVREKEQQAADAEAEANRRRVERFGTDAAPEVTPEFLKFLMDNPSFAFYGRREAQGNTKPAYAFQSKIGQRHILSVPAVVTEDDYLAAFGAVHIQQLLNLMRVEQDLSSKPARLMLMEGLRQQAAMLPIYSPLTGRGYGITARDPVYNLGRDYVDVARGITVPHDFSIGDAARFRDLESLSPILDRSDLTAGSAEAAADIARLWMRRRWENSPLEGLVLFGWACAAIVAGILRRRPSLIISGGKNAGKSDLLEKDIAALWGDHRIDCPRSDVGKLDIDYMDPVRDPSGSGIRQNYGHHSMGLAVDDPNPGESSNAEAQRAEGLLDLADACFGGGRSPRGTPSGSGRPEERLESMMVFSVGRPLSMEKQGRARRMLQLNMTGVPEGVVYTAEEMSDFADQRDTLSALYRDFSQAIRSRIIHSAFDIVAMCHDSTQGNLFSEVVDALGDHDLAQTVTVPLAGARAATTHDGVCFLEEELAELLEWQRATKTTKQAEARPLDAVQQYLTGKVEIQLSRYSDTESAMFEHTTRYSATRRDIIEIVWGEFERQKPQLRNNRWITPRMLRWPSVPGGNLVQTLLDHGCVVSVDGQFIALDPGNGKVKEAAPYTYRTNMRGWLMQSEGVVPTDGELFRTAGGGKCSRGVLLARTVWAGADDGIE